MCVCVCTWTHWGGGVKVVAIPVKVNSTESAAGRRLVILLAEQGSAVREEAVGWCEGVHSHTRRPSTPPAPAPPTPSSTPPNTPSPSALLHCPPATLPGLPIQEQRSHLVFVWDTFTRQGVLRFVVRAVRLSAIPLGDSSPNVARRGGRGKKNKMEITDRGAKN